MGWLQTFYPERRESSAFVIDYEALYQQGYRGIIFDIDNTLTEHGADADDRAERLFQRLRKLGFATCLLSNNKEERVKRFNRNIRTLYLYDAHKPARANYRKAMELMRTDEATTIYIGDQIFTDVWGAKRAGLHNILVEPIDPREEIQIVLKRHLEKIVLYFYEKEHKKSSHF